jgi:hypothetical protein
MSSTPDIDPAYLIAVAEGMDQELSCENVKAYAALLDSAAEITRLRSQVAALTAERDAMVEAASNAIPMMQMAWKQYGVGGMFECMDALRSALALIKRGGGE